MASKQEIDLDKLSTLARLALTSEEKSILEPQLQRIMGYVDQLAEVDIEGVEPMFHALPLSNVLREDKTAAPVQREVLLSNAPAARLGQISVPKVIES